MRKLWGAVIGVFVPAAFLAASSGAVIQTPSGDTCTANGNGTAYSLSIIIPGNAPPEGGFAFGAPGVTVTNIQITEQGTFSTKNLPANTTGAWLLSSPAMPGSISASLTTSGPVTGSFTVVAANSPPSTYFDPFPCAQVSSTPTPSNKFTAERVEVYDPVTGTWHEPVTVPGPGTLIFNQAFKQKASPAASKPLIQSGRVSVKGAGKVKLTLKPTAAGKAALKATGSIKLNLSIEFSPKGGKPANKALSLTLKK